jgi:hypothetical protein
MHQELIMALAQARREFLNPVGWRANPATITALIAIRHADGVLVTMDREGSNRLLGLPLHEDTSLTADLILVTDPAANSITLRSLTGNRMERVSLIAVDLAAMEAMRDRIGMRP